METSLHFCEGFYFPANSNSTLNLRIQNHDWVVCKKTGQGSYDNYYGTYKRQLSMEFQRPVCTEIVDVVLIMYKQSPGSSVWDKYKKNFTFPKNQKKIEILVCELQSQYQYSNTTNQVGNLIGLISMSFLDSCKTDEKKSNVESTSPSAVISSQLSKDLASLLDSDASSDYVLKCAGQEFHVHKCILAARSSVFAAMFRFYNNNAKAQDSMTKSNRKQNKAQDCIQESSTASNLAEVIMDIKPEILTKMLKYIYSGQIVDLTSAEAGDLLYAADKYQLALLKKICVDKLKSTLSASNVLDTLVLGDLHDQSLKAHAMDFICKYPSLSELKKMDQWKSLQTTNPTMVIEVLTSVVGYLQVSKK